MNAEQHKKTWDIALKLIKTELPNSSFQAWVKPAQLTALDREHAIIQVRNEFNRNLIVQNYLRQIEKALQEVTNNSTLKLSIEVNNTLPTDEDYTPTLSFAPDQDIPQNTTPHSGTPTPKSTLNPKFTFETFVVGTHNQFCHAAALSVAQQPKDNPYNPFFVYGGVGLGKTHIAQAIGNHMLSQNSRARIRYITTEQFLNELIESMQKGKTSEFRARYRDIDLLIIDDIQFIQGKESTQQEFFHTFNALREQGAQIIITSDKPPRDLSKLEPRLASRFEGGLVADVQPPTFETRLAILERKATELKIKVPDQIARRIAEAFPENIRSLEGALVKIAAYANFTNKEIDIAMTEQILQLKKAEESRMERIINSVAYHLHLDSEQISGPSRQKKLIQGRQIVVYIARNMNISWTEVSASLGNRGNSSLISLMRNIQTDLQANKFAFTDVVDKLRDQFL